MVLYYSLNSEQKALDNLLNSANLVIFQNRELTTILYLQKIGLISSN